MAGGLFAIDRNYFYEMGEYDPGMDIWGGENLEMSFRIWTCGGRLEIIPCSRVGHVFRQRRPYGSPTGEDTLTYNSLRVAHVWMDEFKKFFFETRPDAINKSYGDISDRVKLRQKLNCSSFDWYVKNVYPDLRLPSPKEDLEKRKKAIKQKISLNKDNVIARKPPKITDKYLIQLSDTKLCIESESEVSYKGSKLLLQKCSKIRRQLWYETAKHDIRLGQKLCLDSGEKYPHLSKCHEMGGSQDWKHSGISNTPFYNIAAGLCLGVRNKAIGDYVIMSLCIVRKVENGI